VSPLTRSIREMDQALFKSFNGIGSAAQKNKFSIYKEARKTKAPASLFP